jgi:phage shock protein PspC (stress-responsive transcriptional regulator)
MNTIIEFIQKYAFGLCAYLGEKFGIAPKKVRLYFIYASFITLGFGFFVYLVMAFFMRFRNYLKPQRSKVWDS